MHAALSQQITSFPLSWTTCLATLATLRQTVRTHRNDEAFMDIDADSILQVLDELGNPEVWPFLRCQRPSADGARSLGTWEQMIYDLEPPADWPIPRQFGVYRIVLHSFSGRRRIGDFQFYLDELIKASPSPFTIITVSLDIVVDAVRGNIADPDVRAFWFHSITQGWTVALLAGPPCETWSELEVSGRQMNAQGHHVSSETRRICGVSHICGGRNWIKLMLEICCYALRQKHLFAWQTLEAMVSLSTPRNLKMTQP